MSGFTILAYVKPTSSLIDELHENERSKEVIRTLLEDCISLISIRWNMDMQIIVVRETMYAFGVNPRFTVSNQTIRNALGDLAEHVDFLRGTLQNTADELVKYKECRERWNVPEMVSESSYGSGDAAPGETPTSSKRRRF